MHAVTWSEYLKDGMLYTMHSKGVQLIYLIIIMYIVDRIGGVMVSVLASSAVVSWVRAQVGSIQRL